MTLIFISLYHVNNIALLHCVSAEQEEEGEEEGGEESPDPLMTSGDNLGNVL